METVLVVGATGNIGISAVQAALRSGHQVLAVVRNQNSANKLFQHVGTKEGITTVEADVVSETGVQSVVDQVKAGRLPAFQHVWSSAGGMYETTRMVDVTASQIRLNMLVNLEANLFAYRATIPYLLEKNDKKSTWTLCTGAQGDIGAFSVPAMTQGALFSMANAACVDNAETNVRFNEVYLAARVEVDSDAEQHGVMKSSDFGKVYEAILSRPEMKGSRVSVYGPEDLQDVKYKKKEWVGRH